MRLGGWHIPQGPPRAFYAGRRRPIVNAGRGRSPWPRYLAWVVIILAAALVGRLGWEAWRYFGKPNRATPVTMREAGGEAVENSVSAFAPWERDMLFSIESGMQDAQAGQMVAAEMDVDRAASLATAMRVESRLARADFFAVSLAGLDRILAVRPDDARMLDHAMQVRIALAELRSAQNGSVIETPPGASSAPNGTAAQSDTPALVKAGAKRETNHVSTDEPRELEADSILDPQALGGSYLDATFMPDTSEVLLPPATRAFADNVRVENLTISGAAQTLDGIHWRNVMFVGTHLRYEDGELDLQNVHFVNCRFGFPSDASGARLANAIALGETSITIEPTADARPETTRP